MARGWVLTVTLLAMLLATSSTPHRAHAQESQPDGPSIFASAWSGLTAGAFVGAGAGYLKGRKDGWKKSDWRAVGLGIGIGALAGAGLGLGLGFADKAGAPGGRYVARDLGAGAGFGAVIGLISGGISAAIKSEPEHLLFGTAIGVCAGAGLGIITGIVEGISKRNNTVTATSGLHMEPSFAVTREVSGSNVVLPGVSGRF
jgi:MFS family permease